MVCTAGGGWRMDQGPLPVGPPPEGVMWQVLQHAALHNNMCHHVSLGSLRSSTRKLAMCASITAWVCACPAGWWCYVAMLQEWRTVCWVK